MWKKCTGCSIFQRRTTRAIQVSELYFNGLGSAELIVCIGYLHNGGPVTHVAPLTNNSNSN